MSGTVASALILLGAIGVTIGYIFFQVWRLNREDNSVLKVRANTGE